MLRLDRERGTWTLRFQPGGVPYTVRLGERLRYAKRDRRVEQDWLRFPVTGISFEDAEAYASWLDRTGRVPGARLCTELEWERAARGEDGREFPHGDSLAPDDANVDLTYGKEPGGFGPDEVGSHPASRSPFGVDDLAGNAWEWTRSSLEPGKRGGARRGLLLRRRLGAPGQPRAARAHPAGNHRGHPRVRRPALQGIVPPEGAPRSPAGDRSRTLQVP